MPHESISFDVLIVGAGPAGLSAAIRLAQLAQSQHRTLSICVLEKAAQVGEHSLSGAVLDPKALDELLPDWKKLGAPLNTPVIQDEFLLLTSQKKYRLPIPATMQNAGNYIIRLSHFCRWLALQAENYGVSIFSGFAAVNLLYDASGKVCGVTTGDKGVDKNGQPTDRYQPGIDIYAKQTLLAEGCRGSLTKTAIQQFNLYKSTPDNKTPHQTYAIGVKELWEVPTTQHKSGTVMHSVGWPLDSCTYGGSFLYHLGKQQVSIGLIVGLDYTNPYLDPYEELQRFKTHPAIAPILKGGKCLAYGAKALNEGGFQSIPTLHFPGGLLIGDAAGFVNVRRIKGIHTSMKSGMLAAEVLMSADDLATEPVHFNDLILKSWVGEELYLSRNIRPAFHRFGLWGGLIASAIDTYLFKGKAPWTWQHSKPDYACLKVAKHTTPIIYPPHDHVLTFDKSSAVYLSNTHHAENQPCHLVLKNPALAIDINYKLYDSPETRYCPAGVYEIVDRETKPRLQINASNCIHCKTCDIKDPAQNINWQPPEGGDGPNYQEM